MLNVHFRVGDKRTTSSQSGCPDVYVLLSLAGGLCYGVSSIRFSFFSNSMRSLTGTLGSSIQLLSSACS